MGYICAIKTDKKYRLDECFNHWMVRITNHQPLEVKVIRIKIANQINPNQIKLLFVVFINWYGFGFKVSKSKYFCYDYV